MQASKKREIRIKADAFREKCRVGRYGIIGLFKECERTGFKLIRYPLGENADLGFTMKKDMDIIIFTNSSVRMSREIFTLAHEIGHVILHMEDVFEYIDDKNTVSNKNSNEKEEEANYFAACLLMPEDNVEKFLDLELNDFKNNGLTAMDIARIMSEFKVSFDMALNRLENLNKINANDRINLDNIRNEKRVGNLLRSVGGNARLNSPSNDIDIPHEYLDYVIYNYNHNAIPKETLERVLDCCKLTIEDVSDRIVVHTEENDDLGELIRGLED